MLIIVHYYKVGLLGMLITVKLESSKNNGYGVAQSTKCDIW